MATPTPSQLPTSVSMADIERLRRDQPEVYMALMGVARSLQDVQKYLAAQTLALGAGVPPTGPCAGLLVEQLGAKLQVQWTEEAQTADVKSYTIYRAAAGTRGTPTTPSYSSATAVGAVLRQRGNCTSTGMEYKFTDHDFSIPNFDPADPARFSYWVTAVDSTGRESIPSFVATEELLTIGPGEMSPEQKEAVYNKLFNAAFESGVTTASISMVIRQSVLGGTNTSPIYADIPLHACATGDLVMISNVNGNTAMNGVWQVTADDVNTLILHGSQGNGAFAAETAARPSLMYKFAGASGGTARQPVPSETSRIPDGTFFWSPWQLGDGVGDALFVSNGTVATNEIKLTAPPAPGWTDVWQIIQGQIIRPGQHLTLSVYARISASATDSSLKIYFAALDATPSFSFTKIINATLLTSTFQRFSFNFALPATATAGKSFFVVFQNTLTSGTGRDIFIYRPMLNAGDQCPVWTGITYDGQEPGNSLALADVGTPTWARDVQQLVYRDSSVTYV